MATKKTPISAVKVKAVPKPLAAKKAAIKKMPAAAAPAKVSKKAIAKSVDMDLMFDLAAETFRVMSAPMRLKIINCLCSEEKNVGQLLDEINTTQPNMSQHLNTLFKAKILGRRREGVQIYYRIINERVVTLCRAVCTQIAIDSDIEHV
jgi:DNA-binding transcriptional ArsR family regulator